MIVNPDSEYDAQNITSILCPDPMLRTICVAIISDGIAEANKYSRSSWAINMNDDAIRLTVAHYYVCTIKKGSLWLALDDVFLRDSERNENYLPTVSDLNGWGWEMDDRDAFPRYKDKGRKRDFSANGRYVIGDNHPEAWKHIGKLFSSFIYKAVYYGQGMDPRSRKRHCSGFLKYARNQFNMALPDPSYDGFS
jgi:hypothetical protein